MSSTSRQPPEPLRCSRRHCAGYRLDQHATIDAIRSLRAVLHGFVTLEAAGGFGLPQAVEATFGRLIDGLDVAFTSWGSTEAKAAVTPQPSSPTA